MAETLSERVAELERERDQARADLAQARVAWAAAERQASAQRQRAETAEWNEARLRVRVKAAESALAQARVVGARTALAEIVGELASKNLPGAARVVTEYVGRKYPATGEVPTRAVAGSVGFKVRDSSPVREAVRVKGNVVTIDCDAVREMAERADRNAAITGAASLRVGGSCADCQALHAEASVTWKTCPKHTLNLRASKPGDTTQGSRVDFRTLDNRGVKEVLSDPAPTPEPLCAVCKGAREVFDPVNSVWTWCRECQSHPPQAAPERFFIVPVALSFDAHGEPMDSVGWARINASDAQHIVALASRPTASGEG